MKGTELSAGDRTRLWLGSGVAVGLLVLVAGWFLLLSPELSATSDTRDRIEDAQLQNAGLQSKIATLQAANAQLPTLVSQLRRSRQQLPVTSGFTTFTDQLAAQAKTAGVTITSVAIGAIAPATGAATGAVAAPAATDTGDSAGSAGSAGGTTGTAASGTAAAAAAGPAGTIFQVQVTLTTTGGLAQQRDFISAVQAVGPRAALISSLQLAPGEGADAGSGGSAATSSLDRSAAVTTVLTVFVQPQSPAATQALAAQLNAQVVR